MSAPERIWADARTCTVYMDGSSPITASTREFRNSTEYTRSDLVAELAAENERLRRELSATIAERKRAQEACQQIANRLVASTGAVGALPRPDTVSMSGGTICLDYADYDLRDEAYDWLEQHASHQRATNTVDAHETANVSDKPEGQQEPVARGVVWFGYDENTGEFTGEYCSVKPHDARGMRPYIPYTTRPADQAVTEEWREIKQHVQPRIADGYTAVAISKPGYWLVKGPGPAAALKALAARDG